jgi:hypothetical protein
MREHHRNGEGDMLGGWMNFGKFRGRHVSDVPTDYLQWALRTCDNLDGWLREAIEEELHARVPPRPQPPRNPPPPVLAGIIAEWYRKMALRYHPDRGGSTLAMQIVNEAVNELRQMLGVTV